MDCVLISEVGPRDGLQSLDITMATANKIAWIAALGAANVAEIEIGSFVSPKRLPQMADCAEVLAAANAMGGFAALSLVPNLRGAERAFQAGARKVSVPVSASDTHSRNNVNLSTDEAIREVARIVALRDSLGNEATVEVGVSTAFGCTLEGVVPEDRVIEIATRLAQAGADSVGLSDTTGYGNPGAVRRLFKRLIAALGDRAGGAHFHNTRGQGMANVLAALDVGVRTFDSSQAGLGGCPWAPGATGNIVTEDLVFLLESMGIDTGIDFARLLEARNVLHAALPQAELYGSVPAAGLPKGFVYAREAA